jgi:hypothetical protein
MAKGASKAVQQQGQKQATGEYNVGQQYAGTAAQGLGGFAETGGISPQMANLTAQKAASNVSSLYGGLKENLARRQKIQGGYAPGAGVNAAALGRGTAAESAQAVNQANLGLAGLQTQNRLAAMQGLGSLGMGELGVSGENLATAQKAAAQPGWFSNLMQGIGTVTGGKGLFGR